MRKFVSVAIFVMIAGITLTGLAGATERPTVPECLAAPGICFAELDEVTFCAFGLTEGGDFWRFCLVGDENDFVRLAPNGKVFEHAVESQVIYLDACPAVLSGADCANYGPLDPRIDFQSGFDGVTGFGRVTFNNVAPCPYSIHGAGSVQNAAGEEFDLTLNSVGHSSQDGCVTVLDSLRITPAQP